VNRATRVECVEGNTGSCGDHCQNQKFQRKQYADVSVFKTEKKGFGLRANRDLQPHDFVFEYIGEVINEATFRRRTLQYEKEGIKHFYFMSLRNGEFVDATKKGNLSRFCNHSCNPNCYIDKWIVGEKLRMGIFVERPIKAGEELVFNYKVDRLRTKPVTCECGEPNCSGTIGGKAMSERSLLLPPEVISALGIDDGDGWEPSGGKKARKKRPEEDDEAYVDRLPTRDLDEDDTRTVMSSLLQCTEKWIVVKILDRISRCDDERILIQVVRMHAYGILRTTINRFIDDYKVVLLALEILNKFPRMTKNKILGSNIVTTVEKLTTSEHEDIAAESKKLLDDWDKLEVAFRIRRRKGEPVNQPVKSFEDRRGLDRVQEEPQASSTSKPLSPMQAVDIPKGPRNSVPQRNAGYFNNGGRGRRPFHFNNANLPEGWFMNKDGNGKVYYYDRNGQTTWQRPTQPSAPLVKAPPKAVQEQQFLQSIIDQVTKEHTPRTSAVQTPQQVETPVKEPKKDRWRSLPPEKQKKIYENTVRRIFPASASLFPIPCFLIRASSGM
jgi:[histone H3]-lysine36 N-trimethyltransferase